MLVWFCGLIPKLAMILLSTNLKLHTVHQVQQVLDFPHHPQHPQQHIDGIGVESSRVHTTSLPVKGHATVGPPNGWMNQNDKSLIGNPLLHSPTKHITPFSHP